MASFEFLALILTGLGLTASILYYASILMNANKTRQTQIFMTLYETYSSKDFRTNMTTIRNWKWETLNEFYEKYGEKNNPEAWNTFLTVATFYNGLGVLLMKNLISIELVEELLSNAIFGAWNYMGEIVLDYRGRQPRHIASRDIFHGFEYLYNELAKRGTILDND